MKGACALESVLDVSTAEHWRLIALMPHFSFFPVSFVLSISLPVKPLSPSLYMFTLIIVQSPFCIPLLLVFKKTVYIHLVYTQTALTRLLIPLFFFLFFSFAPTSLLTCIPVLNLLVYLHCLPSSILYFFHFIFLIFVPSLLLFLLFYSQYKSSTNIVFYVLTVPILFLSGFLSPISSLTFYLPVLLNPLQAFFKICFVKLTGCNEYVECLSCM